MEILFIFTFLKNKINLKIIPKAQAVSTGGIFLLTIIDLIFLNTKTSFFGNPFRLQGIFLLWNFLVLAIMSSSVRLNQIPKVAYFTSFFVLLLSSFILGVNEAGRRVGPLGEPNSLATVILFIWPFLFFDNILHKYFKLIPIAGAIIIVLSSGSRSGLIALSIQLIFIFLSGKISILKSLIISLIFIFLTLFLPFVDTKGIFENRSEIWQTAIRAGNKSPIVGQGFGNIEQALNKASWEVSNNVRFQYVDSSHNFLLDWWVEGGIFGILLIISLTTLASRNFVKSSKKLELTALIGIIIPMLFNPVSVAVLVPFWFLVGQGFILPKEELN